MASLLMTPVRLRKSCQQPGGVGLGSCKSLDVPSDISVDLRVGEGGIGMGEGVGCGDRYAQAVQSIGVEIAALSKSVMNETDSGGD